MLYSIWIRSSSARRTAGSVMVSRWGHSAFRVPFNDSIQAWSVGVEGLPKCWAIATMAMNRRVCVAIICDRLSDTASRIGGHRRRGRGRPVRTRPGQGPGRGALRFPGRW